jgi:hypothetical protein
MATFDELIQDIGSQYSLGPKASPLVQETLGLSVVKPPCRSRCASPSALRCQPRRHAFGNGSYRRPLATGMASGASSALGSVYWLARAAPRHKLNKGLAARFEHGCLPGEILPAPQCDVDISRMKLDCLAAAAGQSSRS